MKRSQDGSSLVEAVLITLLFMVPLIWLLGVLADVHRGALATTAAAREAGADAARASTLDEARRSVDNAVTRAFRDHGLDPSLARVRWSPADLERGAAIEVEVSYSVSVAQVPLLGRASGPSVEVNARHIARVDPYRSRP